MTTNEKGSTKFVGAKLVDGVPCVFTYGYARNSRGQIEQVYSMVRSQRTISQEWTGVVYRNEKQALADSWALNRVAVCEV